MTTQRRLFQRCTLTIKPVVYPHRLSGRLGQVDLSARDRRDANCNKEPLQRSCGKDHERIHLRCSQNVYGGTEWSRERDVDNRVTHCDNCKRFPVHAQSAREVTTQLAEPARRETYFYDAGPSSAHKTARHATHRTTIGGQSKASTTPAQLHGAHTFTRSVAVWLAGILHARPRRGN